MLGLEQQRADLNLGGGKAGSARARTTVQVARWAAGPSTHKNVARGDIAVLVARRAPGVYPAGLDGLGCSAGTKRARRLLPPVLIPKPRPAWFLPQDPSTDGGGFQRVFQRASSSGEYIRKRRPP